MSLGKLHMVNLASSALAARSGGASLRALSTCLQVSFSYWGTLRQVTRTSL